MTGVYVDAAVSDGDRRARLYVGDLFLRAPTPATMAFVEFTRNMVEEALAPHDPELAQFQMPVEDYAAVLGNLKPTFIHHPESKRHLQEVLVEAGCDPDQTYFDVPRLRTSTSNGYLTTGIAYAFHPHRDTWYSAPMAQVNWWMPVYEASADNVIAFHTQYFSRPIANGSAYYNYYAWNRDCRARAASQIGVDIRPQPKPEETVELEPQVRPVPPPGGMLIFSGAHLHSSVPNITGRTRISIDFRTVHRTDVSAHRGAENVDSRCTGTTLRDYLRISDLQRLPEDLVREYDPVVAPDSVDHLVYQPDHV
jgi:hypothetical protein